MKDKLTAYIANQAIEFECEKLASDDPTVIRFRVLGFASDHVLYKNKGNNKWKQEDEVLFEPSRLVAVGKAVDAFYNL